jgi:hypothetical protein
MIKVGKKVNCEECFNTGGTIVVTPKKVDTTLFDEMPAAKHDKHCSMSGCGREQTCLDAHIITPCSCAGRVECFYFP